MGVSLARKKKKSKGPQNYGRGRTQYNPILGLVQIRHISFFTADNYNLDARRLGL
jgi:hypothetical protein